MKKDELTDGEVCIMKTIWDSPEELTVSLILKQVNEHYKREWAIQTASTFLCRLTQKGFLKMRRQGKTYYYTPLISEREYFGRTLTKFMKFWGNDSLKNFVAAINETEKLSENEIKDVQNYLDELL